MDVTIWSTTDTESQVHYVFYKKPVSCHRLTVWQTLRMKFILAPTNKKHFIFTVYRDRTEKCEPN